MSSRIGQLVERVRLLGPARHPDRSAPPRRGHGRADRNSVGLLLLPGTARYGMNLENLLRIQIALGADIRKIWPASNPGASKVTESLLEDLLREARSRRPLGSPSVRRQRLLPYGFLIVAEHTIEEIVRSVCSQEQISIEELIQSRSRRAAQARTLAAALVLEIPHLHLTDLAKRLNRDLQPSARPWPELQKKQDASSEKSDRAVTLRLKRARLAPSARKLSTPRRSHFGDVQVVHGRSHFLVPSNSKQCGYATGEGGLKSQGQGGPVFPGHTHTFSRSIPVDKLRPAALMDV